MLNFGIIAEGLPNTDVLIIWELIKKILSDDLKLYPYPGRDKSNVIRKYRDWLEDCRIKK